ncbi:hypothetical protein EON65_08090 [archaeon]|nr:MAG: hypothetical protein EON65_08090 [archaeon]
MEYTNQEEEDEHPLDLLAFLPVEPTKPSQRIRESDNQKHTTPINRIEMRGNVNFHKLTAELSLFTERS